MALLNMNTYKDPRANILYGGGNKNISDDDIRSFIKSGKSDSEIQGEALNRGISADQISNAMKGDPRFASDNVNKYLTQQGITKDLANTAVSNPAAVPSPVSVPKSVVANNVNVGKNETVQGQLHGLLENTNNPLMVQARTAGNSYSNKRGLLDSSIGASAAESSMINAAMPIAQQDASTYYDANKVNAGNKLTADTFNADQTSRVGMFNADQSSRVGMFNSDQDARVGMFNSGQDKDIMMQREGNQIQRESNALQFDIAKMDSDNKLAIANIQALANDSGIIGDMGKSLMNLYQQTAADPNITPEVKDQIYANLNKQSQSFLSLLPSIQSKGASLNFSGASNSGGTSTGNNTSGGLLDSGSGGFIDISKPATPSSTQSPAANKLNTFNYQVEPTTLGNVMAYEKKTGQSVDRSRVVPQQLIEDLRYGQSTPAFGTGYIANDGTTKQRNFASYDFQKLMKDTGAKNQGELFDKLFAPVQPPGTMRTDSPMFYVYR